MDVLSLNELLGSVMSAVIDANMVLNNHHLSTLSQHFTFNQQQQQWEPNTMTMKLPRHVLQEGDDQEQPVDVPTAALISNHSLAMDNLKLDFGCNIQQVQEDAQGNKTMMISMSSAQTGSLDKKLSISMVIRSGEPSEGASRLRDALVKKI